MTDEPTIPKLHELMWLTLQSINELGGSATVQEIVEKVGEIADFSEEQQQVLHKGGPQTEIEYRLAWARTYLKGVGALENSARGVWSITDAGRKLTPEEMSAVHSRYRAIVAARRAEEDETQEQSDDEEGLGWKDRLLSVLLNMEPDAFERLARRLLREAGFLNVTVTGKSGDGGIDGIGVYRLSLVSFPVFFQCKRWRGSVPAGAVRDFRGAMVGRGEKGLLITTGSFTSEAQRESTRDGAPPIDLIDGDRLCDLLKKYGLGVTSRERIVEEVELAEEFFSDL